MARATSRRPLPALVFLLALIALTAVVWVRVLSRDSSAKASQSSCPAPSSVVLPQPTAVKVQVLNGTQRNGLAHAVATTLQKDGFVITAIANDEQALGGIGEIRYGPAGFRGAQLLSYYLPGAKLVDAQLPDAGVVISLGARFTTVLTPAVVSRQLAGAKVSQSPAPPRGTTPSRTPASPSATSASSIPASCAASS